jgi:hypothetical protein
MVPGDLVQLGYFASRPSNETAVSGPDAMREELLQVIRFLDPAQMPML